MLIEDLKDLVGEVMQMVMIGSGKRNICMVWSTKNRKRKNCGKEKKKKRGFWGGGGGWGEGSVGGGGLEFDSI